VSCIAQTLALGREGCAVSSPHRYMPYLGLRSGGRLRTPREYGRSGGRCLLRGAVEGSNGERCLLEETSTQKHTCICAPSTRTEFVPSLQASYSSNI
jgi:hypothetical protein